MAKPVSKRQTSHESVKVTVKDVAFGGDGVADLPDGKICFITGVLSGEDVEVVLVDERKKFSFGRVKHIHQPSEHRVEPLCEFTYDCGGCQYWHTSYEHEIELKTKQLKDLLKRLAGVDHEVNVMASETHQHYRQSITVHKTRSGKLGFVAQDQKSILDIPNCLIAHDKLNEILQDKPEDIMRLAEMDITFKTDGAELSTPRKPLRLAYVYQEYEVFYDVRCFFQSNANVLTQMIDFIRKNIQLTDILFDLYCGVGVFAITLSDLFSKVVGLEHTRRSVQFGQFNTQNLEHVEILKGKVEEKFPRIYKRFQGETNTVLLDPPRTGLDSRVIDDLRCRKAVSQIVYCSCEPSILARDLKRLLAGGVFEVSHVALADMFPRTKHFETLVILKRS